MLGEENGFEKLVKRFILVIAVLAVGWLSFIVWVIVMLLRHFGVI